MLEVIVGCMFSGKSEELTRRLKRAKIAGQSVIAFKPKIDDRYSSNEIASHSGQTFESFPISKSLDIAYYISSHMPDAEVIGIDEAQFFDDQLISIVEILSRKQRVLVAGLDMDYKGNPFGPIPHLMAVSDSVSKLTAICVSKDSFGRICGEPATRSYRLSSKDSGNIVQVGAVDSYQARCRKCWENGRYE